MIRKLKSIADRVPELLSYCHSAYANPSVLYGQYIAMSQEGPQQGDPLVHLRFRSVTPFARCLNHLIPFSG